MSVRATPAAELRSAWAGQRPGPTRARSHICMGGDARASI